MFFDGWGSLGRIIVIGLFAYAALVLFVRVSGKRTLSKMNAFDLIVTVALGSTLSTIILDPGIALAEGLAALAVLIGLQFAVAWTSARSRRVEHLVRSRPRAVAMDGAYVDSALQAERLTRDDVDAAVRKAGFARVDGVHAVVLESNGELSVIAHTGT